MVAVTLRQGTRQIPAFLPPVLAERGNVIHRADGEWQVVDVTGELPQWWSEMQQA